MSVSEPPLAAGAPFQTLRNYHRWVPHKDKVPRQTGNGRAHARVDDPRTWSSYALARRARGMTGLGFMLMDLPDIAVGDLDHCRDPVSGELTAWAHDLLAKVGVTYVEISVSGCGLHVFGVVAPDVLTGTYVLPRGAGGQKIELYVRARRMIVVTDNVFTDAPLADLSDVARELIAEHAAKRGHRKTNGGQQTGATSDLDGVPAEIVDLIVNGAAAGGDRSERFYYVVAVLREHGWSKADIIAVLHAHPQGIAARCFEHGRNDLARQAQLCLDKIDDARAAKGAKAAASHRHTIRLEPGLYTEIAVATEVAIGDRPPTAFRTSGALMHPIVGHADDEGSTLTPALEPIGVDGPSS